MRPASTASTCRSWRCSRLISLWVLGLDLWQVIVHHRVWTGTDGVYIVDQQQYLSWIRDASNHVLSSNLYVLHPTPHDYFQPAVLISGGLTALGMAPWLSLLLWKPVAVVDLFLGGTRVRAAQPDRAVAAPGGAGADPVLRLLHGRVRERRRARRPVARVPVLGLHVRADRAGRAGRRAADLRQGVARGPDQLGARPARGGGEPASPVAGRGADRADRRPRARPVAHPAGHPLAGVAGGGQHRR